MIPGIKQSEFKARRDKLMQQMDKNSIAIIMAAPEHLRAGDSHYAYRQNSNFQYLTGFDEPYAAAVFIPGRKEGEFVFFNQSNDLDLEIWIGKRVGQEGACQAYGADEAFPIEKLDDIMPKLMQGKETLYYGFGVCNQLDKQVANWLNQIRRAVRAGVGGPEKMVNLNQLIHEMRLIKSEAEIQLMRTAAELSAKAHILGMKAAIEAKYEYQVEAILWHHLNMNGCRSWAYPPIVGCGPNACILHYIQNEAPLKKDELLLVDAGGEYQYYAADITRTYPVNGKFSEEQKMIYELVLQSQKAAIESIKPETPWITAQKNIIRVLTEGLVKLAILKGSVEQLIKDEAYKEFYMHNSGHWLGLDVHDAGAYKINDEWRLLKPGMVLTVEPGLYIKPNKNVDPRWWNIGVRIEDDVLVTEQGCEVLSAEVPKEIKEIEALMRG